MRLGSLHPSLPDRAARVALWREGLLAQKVLLGKTKGHRFHPQLARFRTTMMRVEGSRMGRLVNGLSFFASATATALPCTLYRTSYFRSDACRPNPTSSSSTTKPASGNPSRPFLPTKATLPKAQTPPNGPS